MLATATLILAGVAYQCQAVVTAYVAERGVAAAATAAGTGGTEADGLHRLLEQALDALGELGLEIKRDSVQLPNILSQLGFKVGDDDDDD
eukprot:COSAG01_NODE_28540_length_658_cov_19.903399_1_plen_89_part_10